MRTPGKPCNVESVRQLKIDVHLCDKIAFCFDALTFVSPSSALLRTSHNAKSLGRWHRIQKQIASSLSSEWWWWRFCSIFQVRRRAQTCILDDSGPWRRHPPAGHKTDDGLGIESTEKEGACWMCWKDETNIDTKKNTEIKSIHKGPHRERCYATRLSRVQGRNRF